MRPTYHIETYGCQMNVLDSELIAGILLQAGYEVAESMPTADVVLLNTCAVREGAENRVLNRLAAIRGDRRVARGDDPGVLGLLGCVAQSVGEALVERAPYLDLIVGTDRYRELPRLLEEARRRHGVVVDVRADAEVTYEGAPRVDPSGVTGFVSVMRGCEMPCTFCIVPQTRGEERSQRPLEVLREVRWLADQGVKEVTLLGQKVNAYRWEDASFAGLLRLVAGVPGIERVRFTSPHPLWITRELVATMAAEEKICPSMHVPLQSGSAAVLKRMRRGYSPDRFRRGVELLRGAIPDAGLSTDVIVGFPGESEADHRATLELLAEVRFDSAYMFAYSRRRGTPAAEMADQVPGEVAQRRLREVIALQEGITREVNDAQVGRVARVLLERASRKRGDEFFGRTAENRPVVLGGDATLVGSVVDARIVAAHAHTLRGEVGASINAGGERLC
jgi:tRNA-2-methylthio-N6-dimethylallyladenosine synthase